MPWKTAEIGAFEVGNFALFSCPGFDVDADGPHGLAELLPRDLAAAVAVDAVEEGLRAHVAAPHDLLEVLPDLEEPVVGVVEAPELVEERERRPRDGAPVAVAAELEPVEAVAPRRLELAEAHELVARRRRVALRFRFRDAREARRLPRARRGRARRAAVGGLRA